MTLVTRILIPVADVRLWHGWRVVYTTPGGWRGAGEMAVMERQR